MSKTLCIDDVNLGKNRSGYPMTYILEAGHYQIEYTTDDQEGFKSALKSAGFGLTIWRQEELAAYGSIHKV